jgi:signal transduction histidine kinase
MILLIGIINVVYLINFQDQAYETIDFVEENYLRMRLPGEAGGPMGMGGPGAMNGTGQLPEEDDWEDRDDEDFEDHLFSGFRRDGSALTPDTRYETSFFVVSLDADGSVTEMDHSYIASVSEEDIDAYAKEILASGKEQGRADYFMYKVFDSDDGTSKIVAVSCYQQLRQFRLLLSICILAGFLYMAAVFALVWLMSRRITKPVEESIQKQRQFITDAGHELKTPITIIKANNEVLQMQNGSNQWTQSIENQTRRLSSLVQSLLELSRLNEKDIVDISEEFDLSKTVSEAVESFRVPIESDGKVLETAIEEGIRFKGSKDEMYRLVSLLMDNARKYSTDREPVRVTLNKHHRITLTVSNSCEHIEQEKLDRLFERFYRTDESRSRKTGGNGIGLSVVQAIVERHNGTVTASSSDGTSIQFTAVF